MNKVYFDKENKHWFVYELEDFYSFKSVNYLTNEETNQIISWTRGFDMDKYPKHIRVYDVEINQIKYYFLIRKHENVFVFDTEDPMALDKLVETENIFFTGETLS